MSSGIIKLTPLTPCFYCPTKGAPRETSNPRNHMCSWYLIFFSVLLIFGPNTKLFNILSLNSVLFVDFLNRNLETRSKILNILLSRELEKKLKTSLKSVILWLTINKNKSNKDLALSLFIILRIEKPTQSSWENTFYFVGVKIILFSLSSGLWRTIPSSGQKHNILIWKHK